MGSKSKDKDKDKEIMEKEETGFGIIVGSFLRAIFTFIKFLVKVLFKLLKTFGLIPAAVYALFGLVLYLGFSFNPLDLSTNSLLYIAGFSLTIVVAIIISVRNFFLKPLKTVVSGYKNPVWKRKTEGKEGDEPIKKVPTEPQYIERKKQKTNRKNAGKVITEEEYSPNAYVNDKKTMISEEPKIYRSSVDKNIVIHEYNDRFEVYRKVGGRLVKDKIEFKDYDVK